MRQMYPWAFRSLQVEMHTSALSDGLGMDLSSTGDLLQSFLRRQRVILRG